MSGQWSQFRGPNGSGIDSSAGYPVVFSPSKNVVWKTAVPFGQSSPVLAGGHLYLTANEGDKLLTICLDATTGRELWRRELRPTTRHKIYKANDPASPSPVADADGVVVFFPDFGLAAYTPDGKDRWTVPLGPFKSFYGMGASPILTEGLAVLVCDQQSGSFVIAVDRKTGVQRWKQERPDAMDAYATPMVFRPAAGPAQLIVLGSSRLESYASTRDSSAGGCRSARTARWAPSFPAVKPSSSRPQDPASRGCRPFETILEKHDTDKDGRVSAQGVHSEQGLGRTLRLFRPRRRQLHLGEGVDDDAQLRRRGVFRRDGSPPWQCQRKAGRQSGGVALSKEPAVHSGAALYQNVFYMVKDGGIVTALDAKTGKLLSQVRSPIAMGEYHASPVAADGKVFLANIEGKVTVLKAGPAGGRSLR